MSNGQINGALKYVVAIVLIFAIGVAAAVSSESLAVTVMAATAPVVGALLMILTKQIEMAGKQAELVKGQEAVRQQVDVVHTATNSIVNKLVAKAEVAAKAEGALEEKERQENKGTE